MSLIGVALVPKCIASYCQRRPIVLSVYAHTYVAVIDVYLPIISCKTERFSFKSVGGKAFKRRLIHSIALTIMA